MDSDADENLQRLWQSTYFAKDAPCFDSVAKGAKHADAYRSLIFQLNYAKSTNSISSSCWEYFMQEFMVKYSQAVDNQSGLSNFSEGALAIAAHRKNESSAWKSTLADMPLEELILPKDIRLQEAHDEKELQQLVDVLNTNRIFPTATSEIDIPKQNEQPLSKNHSSLCGSENIQSTSVQVPVLSNAISASNYKQLTAFQQSTSYQPPVSNSLQKRKNMCSDNISTFDSSTNTLAFRTAKEQFVIEQHKKPNRSSTYDSGPSKKSLGSRRGLHSKFVSPILNKQENDGGNGFENDITDDRLKNIDPKMVEMITNEIMDYGPPVSWDDIAGLAFAKSTIKEIVVWPMLRPDIFRGLRGPPKGILLFGPPGTGKTMIGKCIASQSKSTFFSISASSLTSKWIGDGEKMVRALFAVARCYLPAVVFIDEIDSLLSQRSETEHESSRRLKTEFLVQLDGATTCSDERLLIVGATNRPQELDEAARRRLVKRLYIPLPEEAARKQIVRKLLDKDGQILSEEELDIICHQTEGYSGADMTNLCKEASLGPIRSINFEDIEHISTDQVRLIVLQDFIDALKQVRASVSEKDLEIYLSWNKQYGSISTTV